jgi:hypothetical protein
MEETKEAVVPVTTDTAQPTVTTEAPEVDYKAELEKTKQALDVAQKEAKAHQSTASKKAEEARRLQEKVNGIDARFDAFAEVLEEHFKQPVTEDYGEKPKQPSFKERLQEKIKTVPNPEVTAQIEHDNEVIKELVEIEKATGLKFDKSKEFREAHTEFRLRNYDGALELAKEVQAKMVETKVKEVDPMVKKVADLEAENARLKKIASGDLNSEKGQPVGGNLSDAQFKKDFAAGNLPVTKANIERLKKL